jgi:hypothetical protein
MLGVCDTGTEVPSFTVVWVAHGWQRIEAYDSVTL